MQLFTDKTGTKSLEEVHGSVDPSLKRTGWGKIMAFFGPAYLISVGYMDPGNWATDIAGGSQFGYSLIWVLLMSNVMALLLQSLSARLGIVAGRDLAQASRETFAPFANIPLYILAEIAIAACDLAEVLGMAIGLNLLFGLPILYGVAITILDTFLLLYLQKLGMRRMEAFIISLVAIIGMSFFAELIFAKPDVGGIIKGFVPSIPTDEALYITIGIIGATVMPHNLYLHSALVQTRKIARNESSIKKYLKFSFIDSAIALNIAFFVNASILILAAAVFFKNGYFEVADIQDAHKLLAPLLGEKLAPILFAVALIASGQSSTITGTLAGQIIMEGYIHLRLPMWIRRTITRLLAVVPAFFVIWYFGEDSTGKLLIFSQVVLSLQLAYAIIPLIHFTADKKRMGNFAIKPGIQIAAWIIALIIISLNVKLVYDTVGDWMQELPDSMLWLKILIFLIGLALAALLVYISFKPLFFNTAAKPGKFPHGSATQLSAISPTKYSKIAVTVDFSELDNKTIAHALNQGGKEAEYILIHIVETAGAILVEKDIDDMESTADQNAIQQYVSQLQLEGYEVISVLGNGRRAKAIAAIINQERADIVVMGAHGHSGFKDVVFGQTINTVRHLIKVPLLAVK
ncbi:MAG: iron/manganese transporter [Sphingobacteriales bacterium]|nr:MAG: iron/manganese transporter [Sphingobacteriales bacterium]